MKWQTDLEILGQLAFAGLLVFCFGPALGACAVGAVFALQWGASNV